MPPAGPRALLVVWVEHSVPTLTVGRALWHTGKFIPLGVVVVVRAVGQGGPNHLRHRICELLKRNPAFSLANGISTHQDHSVHSSICSRSDWFMPRAQPSASWPLQCPCSCSRCGGNP